MQELPTVVCGGRDLFLAVESLLKEAEESGDEVTRATAVRLLQIMEQVELATGEDKIIMQDGKRIIDPAKRVYLRAHPKVLQNASAI